MAKSIRVRQKHGVNPSIPVCFWCGKEKNEIVLLGRLPKDAEAPMKGVYNYEPCEECLKHRANGITVIEVTESVKSDFPPIQGDFSPTGRWSVLREGAVTRVFNPEVLPELLEKRVMLMDTETYQTIIFGEEN